MNNRNTSNRNVYEKIARLYADDEPVEEDPVMRKECRKLFAEEQKGKDILEIGCGPGVDSHFLSQSGLDVTATDFTTEFIRIVRARFPHSKAHQMDMTQPDLPEKLFDGIYAFASFIHLPRSEAAKTLNGFQAAGFKNIQFHEIKSEIY